MTSLHDAPETPPAEEIEDVQAALRESEWLADDLTIRFPADGVMIEFTGLYDDAHGIDGYITVKSQTHGLLHWGQLNLASLQARSGIIRKLQAAYPIEWARKIEDACYEAATGFRRGQPLDVLLPRRRPEIQQFWVAGLIRKVATVFYGPGGEGKSLVALAAGISIASGTSIIGDLEVKEKAPVAYLDFEEERPDQEERLADLLDGAGLEPPETLYYKKLSRPLIRELSALRPELAKYKVRLVILDSLSWAATPGLRWDEQAQEVFGALRQFSPATPLVIGHVNAAAAASSEPSNPFGSVLVRNAARMTWEVRAAERLNPADPLFVSFHERKRNRAPLPPHGFKIQFDTDPRSITIISTDMRETPQLLDHASATAKILAAARSGAKTYRRYAAETGLRYRTVQSTVRRLVDQKQMQYVKSDLSATDSVDKGARYGLTEKRQEAPEWPGR